MLGRIIDILRIPLFIICVIVIIFLGIYFDVLFIVPAFVGSLFIVQIQRGAMLRNVIGGQLIGFVCAFIAPIAGEYINLDFLPDQLVQAIFLGLAVAIASLIMIISGLKHEPGIATVFLFFSIDKGKNLIFDLVPLTDIIIFGIGLIVIGLISWMYLKNK
jgi:hypothetical protein